MGLNPAHRFDQARRAKRETEQVRLLRVRPRGHAETKTFIVPGDITTDTFIPPCFFGLDPDNTIPEVKILFELGGFLSSGTADLTFTMNGVSIPGSDMAVSASYPSSITVLDAPLAISHHDYLQVTVAAATAATNLSVVAYLVTRQA